MFGRARRSPVPVRLGEAGVAAFASRHAPGFAMEPTCHPFAKLLLVCGGSGRFNAAGVEHALAPGHALRVPAQAEHRLVDDEREPLRLLGVCAVEGAGEADLDIELARLLPPCVPIAVDDGEAERALRRLLFEQTERRPGRDAALRALWTQARVALLRALARRARLARGRGPAADDGVVAALAWLDEHWHLPVTLADLARRAGLPLRTFTARVRCATGESVKRRLHRLRLGHAERLLRAGAPVLDAALSAGFNDLAHFYRVFRAAHGGVPPGRWAGR